MSLMAKTVVLNILLTINNDYIVFILPFFL